MYEPIVLKNQRPPDTLQAKRLNNLLNKNFKIFRKTENLEKE